MKAIKETVEKIVGWEAWDGTRFSSEDECKKYEHSAIVVLRERYENMVTNKGFEKDGESFASCVSFDYETIYQLVHVRDANDLMSLNQFRNMLSATWGKEIDYSYIGKDIVVANSEGEPCWFIGTIDEWKERVIECIDSLFEAENSND